MRIRDEEKERSIKEAVIKLILQEGFYGTSISKIAKEAGVSPATLYVYFESKEAMLQDIYREYSEKIYSHLLNRVHLEMEGRQLIEILVRSYYNYIQENEEVFNFVEQFSGCPSLACGCAQANGVSGMIRLIAQMRDNRIIKDYNIETLLAIIFYPVKAIAANRRTTEAQRAELLGELIEIIQDALLV